jgi:hypothetical protein
MLEQFLELWVVWTRYICLEAIISFPSIDFNGEMLGCSLHTLWSKLILLGT